MNSIREMIQYDETKGKFVEGIKEVIHDTEVLLRETAGDLNERAKEARERLSQNLEEAKERLKEIEIEVKERAVEGVKETDRVIREHPYEAIGMSFGIGLLIGIFLNRK